MSGINEEEKILILPLESKKNTTQHTYQIKKLHNKKYFGFSAVIIMKQCGLNQYSAEYRKSH